MKSKNLLLVLLMSISLTSFSTVWTVGNSGNTFTPSSITIDLGDTVVFNITSSHDAVEVSEATYNANGTTPLPGFQVPFGGDTVLPAELGLGTHYYVCTPHAGLGMKGQIIVEDPSLNLKESELSTKISAFPNPSNGIIQIETEGELENNKMNLEVYDLQGQKIYEAVSSSKKTSIDLSQQKNGIYFVKLQIGESVITKKVLIE